MPSADPLKRNAHSRAWYARNKASHRERVYAARQRAWAEVDAKLTALKSQPCTDCGGTFPPVCMDWDHVRGEKVAALSKLKWDRRPWAVIEAEIAKCELVCANCHRIRTEERRLAGEGAGRAAAIRSRRGVEQVGSSLAS